MKRKYLTTQNISLWCIS